MNNQKDKNVLGNFFQTTRGQAIIKLGGFFLFFIVLISVVKGLENKVEKKPNNDKLSSSSSSIKDNTSSELTFGELKQILSSKNYSFSSDILINNENYAIIGIKNKGNYSGSYMISSEEGIIYSITDNNIYAMRNDKFVSDPDLFKDINFNYIDVKYLITETNSYVPIIQDTDQTKIYTYTLQDYEVKFYVEKNIERITVESVNNNDNNTFSYTTHLTY